MADESKKTAGQRRAENAENAVKRTHRTSAQRRAAELSALYGFPELTVEAWASTHTAYDGQSDKDADIKERQVGYRPTVEAARKNETTYHNRRG